MATPEEPQPTSANGDEPLISRMQRTLRDQRPEAERAAEESAQEEQPRVSRRGETRTDRARRERRDISRAGEAGRPEEAAEQQGARREQAAAQPQAVRPEEAAAQPRAVRPEEAAAQRRPERASRQRRQAPRQEPGEQGGTPDPLVTRLAQRLATLRTEKGWSLLDLAHQTGLSRSTLSRSERGEVSPTAAALAKFAAAYDRPLSSLLAEVEAQPRSVVRSAEQTITGADEWRRRAVSPPFPGLRGSIVDAQLLPGTDVTYEPPVVGAEQHLWLISGNLEVTVHGDTTVAPPAGPGEDLHGVLHRHGAGGVEGVPDATAALEAGSVVLIRGDCLRLRLWGPARLRCLSPDAARYAMVSVTP